MRSPSGRVLKNRVDIYRSYPGRDADGGVQFPYPVQPTMSRVPCTVQPVSCEEAEDQQRITKITTYKIMFATDQGLSPRDMIVWSNQGTTHFIFAKADRNEAGRNAAFTIYAEERT